MKRTYVERQAGSYAHLAQTVDQYLSPETPLWWVEHELPAEPAGRSLAAQRSQPIACLWMGTAIDQIKGDRNAHIFLLYVAPEHRRQGIGSALMSHAENWAKSRGDRQIGLQVFRSNQLAIDFYYDRGFEAQSLWMVKALTGEDE